MKVILLCNSSIYAKALAVRLLECNTDIKAILVEKKKKAFGIKPRLIQLISLTYFLQISNLIRPTLEKFVLMKEKKLKQLAKAQFIMETRCEDRWPKQCRIYYFDNLDSPEAIRLVKNIEPDVGFVFGTRILKESIIEAARGRLINFHSSLLPAHRGFFPEFWQLKGQDRKSIGYTLHYIEAQVDAGDILFQEPVPYDGHDPFQLRMRNVLAMYSALPRFISKLRKNQLKPQQQEKTSKLNYYKNFTVETRYAYYAEMTHEKH